MFSRLTFLRVLATIICNSVVVRGGFTFRSEWAGRGPVGGMVLANSHPANELRMNRCMNSLGREMGLRGANRCSSVCVVVTSTRTLASGTRRPRGMERGVLRITLSCLTYKVSPGGSAVFIRSVVPRLARLAFCCVGLMAISHIRHGPAIGTRVRVHGFRTDVPIKFFYCPVDRTTSVATFHTATIPINRSRLPVLRRYGRVIRGFGSICNRALARPRVVLPDGGTYLQLPNVSNGTGVDGSLNGYVCLTRRPRSVGGGIVSVFASPGRLHIRSPNGIRNGPIFVCLSTFYHSRRFTRF